MVKVEFCCENLIDFLAKLPSDSLNKLLGNPYACKAILRYMPPLCKQYVLRLLHVDIIVRAQEIETGFFPKDPTKHKIMVDKLLQLEVFLEVLDRKKKAGYRLNSTFQSQIRQALVNGCKAPREPFTISNAPTPDELDDYALQKWEDLLLLLVKQSANLQSSKPFLMNILKCAGLLKSDRETSMKLTAQGFQFLLMDMASQLWYIIKEYISTTKDEVTVILFLLELGFHTIGMSYSMNDLDVQHKFVEELSTFGLVKYERKEKFFIPTKLVTILEESFSQPLPQQEATGVLIVETNFKLYGYTNYIFHHEILNIFARIEMKLPNLIIGDLTREAMYAAFDSGITAEQVIQFLTRNSHPRVAKNNPPVPDNVISQLRLWEKEKNRIEITPACIYSDFPTQGFFENSLKHARKIGALVWKHTDRKQLVVHQEKDNEMRDFMISYAS